jgi:hypothetical protein
MKKPTVEIEKDENGLFVVADGKRIAKRGEPGTPQAKTWVSLEPGWVVRDVPIHPDGSGGLIVEHEPADARPQ